MNLKGGVLIIGSLYWDDSLLRNKWRLKTFFDISSPIYTPVKIRYGRESVSRQNNYTMILSNHPSTKPGKAMILEIKRPIKSFSALKKLAFDLSEAEGIYKKPNAAKLNSTWGTVGLLLNPRLEKIEPKSANIIIEGWTALYNQYENFNPTDYSITKKEDRVVDENGILNIDWTKQMRDFDFLLATVTKPKPQKQLTPLQIAKRVVETGNGEYFFMNRKYRITTFQDEEILKLLKVKGFKFDK